jgi:hypothetical protein
VVAVAAGGGTSKLKSLYSYPKQNDESQGHTLFVKRDGTLWAMGSNNSGQLGIGTRDNDAHPVPVKVANHVVAVSAGSQFSLFLREDGTLWGMGVHSNNQLGLGYGGNTTVAGIVYSTAYPQTYKPSLIASGVVAAAAGDKNSLFVKSDHTLWYAGGDRIFPRKVADQVVAAATGGLSLYVKNDGTLWKVLDTNNWSVSQLADPVAPGCGSKVTAVAASDFALYTYKPGPCLTPDPNQPYSSNLKGFGLNHDGQLNPSFSEYVTTPTTIGGLLVATLGKLHFSNYYFDSDLGQSGEYIYPPQHSLVVATSVSSSNGGLQSVGPKPPPVIVIAGGDFQQSLQRIIIIDASGSTSSTGGPLTYQWSSSDPVWISGNTTAAPTVGLGYSRRLNTLQLTVTDSTGNSSTQQIQIEYLGPLQ